MRLILLATAVTALPDAVKEIIAQGMTENWLVNTLAEAAPFGKHHLRKRRQAECEDKHGSCAQYLKHCTNSQFQTTCPVTCNSCPAADDGSDDGSDENVDAKSGDAGEACVDTMQYCPSMNKYCDNQEYQGVRLYCRKTCDSCNEELEPVAPMGNGTESNDPNACEDKAWCTNFPYCNESQQLRERILKDCPIECKELRCQASWKTAQAPTQPPKLGADPIDECNDQSQACAGIAELCDQDNYVSTLQTYCQKTCNFCTPSTSQPTLPEAVPTDGECKNQYPNCEGMKFLCTEENNEYNQRYRDLCPETCSLCGAAGVSPSAPVTMAPVLPQDNTPEVTACEDKAKNCNELIDFCGQENTGAMMRAQCAKTCNFCSVEEATPAVSQMTPVAANPATMDPNVCEDQPGHDCAKYLTYCENENTKVPELCKKSCGLCGDGGAPIIPTMAMTTKATTMATTMPTTMATTMAVSMAATAAGAAAAGECILATKDKSPTCKKYAKFCNNPKYEKKLTFQCPMTCKICQKPATTPNPNASAQPSAAAAECKDKVPKQCAQLKRHCKSPKYLKVLKFKCPLTCGFCGAGAATTPAAPTGATGATGAATEKFGTWSINWSKCSPSCQQYKNRKCLQPPCTKTTLYQFQKCPAADYPNIAKCQGAGAAGSTSSVVKPVQTCKNAAGRVFCQKHTKKCLSTKPKEKLVMNKQCRLECGLCTQT